MSRLATWATHALVLAGFLLLAVLHARAGAQFLGAWLAVSPSTFLEPLPPRVQPQSRSGAVLLERNPFDSTWVAPGRAGESALPTLRRCTALRVAIVTQSSDPTWSLATLADAQSGGSRMVRAGDVVWEREVVFVGHDPWLDHAAVWMRERGRLCRVPMALARSAGPRGDVPARGNDAPSGAPFALPEHVQRRIRLLRDGLVEVHHEAFDEIVQRFARYVGPLKVRRAAAGGPGARLDGIAPGSLLDALGLRNGDVVRSVNGLDVSTAEAALPAYARLRAARHFVLALERGGRPTTIDVVVR